MAPNHRRSASLLRRALTTVALCASLLVSLVVVAQPASALTTAQMNSSTARTINAIRAQYRLPALKWSATLAQTAAAHTLEMQSHNRLTNQVPGEASVATRLSRAGFVASRAYENSAVARSQAAVLAQAKLMLSSPARRAIALSRAVTYVGVAVRYDALRHRYWVAMDFGYPTPPASVSIANAVLGQLNAERRANGLPALSMNARLITSAHAHNHAMAAANTMSHQLPGELDFAQRILRAGYNYQTAGENVGWNSLMTTSGALYLETLMYTEVPPNDGHRRNILSSNYRSVGIDILFDSTNHKMWLTCDFGSLLP